MATPSGFGKTPVLKRCPPTLIEAITHKNVVIFCGAGISMEAPSAIPSWGGFNEALFTQIKARARMLSGLSGEAITILDALTLVEDKKRKDTPVLPTEGFSDAVADLLLSDEYFPALKILDSDSCNANHGALAQLAKAGTVRAIVTTNFDTLIERAFNAAGVEFDSFVSHEDYDRGSPVEARVGLYKVHGSADAPDSQKDTATQKFQGLPFYVRARLGELFRKHHVLVLGFSGGDLKFGEDYLGFGQLSTASPGITWVARPRKKPEEEPEDALVSERVHQLLECAGNRAAIVECKLADLFSELGVPPGSAKVATEDPRVAEARANERAARYLQTFFEAKALAPLRCACFCATLLRGAGRSASARVIESALEQPLQGVGDELTSGHALDLAIVAAALAKAACEDQEPQSGNRWALNVLRLAENVETPRKVAESPADSAKWRKLKSIAWSSRGLCFMMCNQIDEATKSLAEAKALLDADDAERALLSNLQSNEAYLLWKTKGSTDEVLKMIRRSSASAQQAGYTGSIAAASHFESLILVSLGEYDSALRALQRGLDAVSVSGNVRDKAGLVVDLAKIDVARGEIERAFKRMQDLIQALPENPGFTAGLFMMTAQMMGFHPPLRAQLLEMAEIVVSDFDHGRIPAEGLPPNVPARADIERIREYLTANRLPENPFLSNRPGQSRDREGELRRLIIEHEFAGRRSELPKCFLELFESKLGRADPSRIMDFAVALGCAAERVDDPRLQLLACCQRMIAFQQAGELRKALLEFEKLKVGESASADPTFAAILHFAGSLHSLIGTPQEAERLLQSARDLNLQAHNRPAAARDILELAAATAREGAYARAIEFLHSGGSLITSLSIPALIQKRDAMLARFQRGCARPEGAMPVSIGLRQPLLKARLTAGDVPHLRSLAASAEDLLTVARYALGSGLSQEARDLTLEASLVFGEQRDACGIADCLSFLADIAQTQRQWEKAFEFSKMASDACARIDDPAREIASLAVLAFCLYKLEDFASAKEAATSCLLRGEGRPPSRPILIACYVRGAACQKSDDVLGTLGSVSAFLKAYPMVKGVEDLSPLRDSFQQTFPAGLQ